MKLADAIAEAYDSPTEDLDLIEYCRDLARNFRGKGRKAALKMASDLDDYLALPHEDMDVLAMIRDEAKAARI